MALKILLVDDDPSLAEMLRVLLEGEGFRVAHAADGEEALRLFEQEDPALVLLDVMLPKKDGIEVCETIRETSGIPIIMLTARTDSVDVVRGLEAGADDYVTKPFEPEVLMARIRARLRVRMSDVEEVVFLGDLKLMVKAREVWRDGEKLKLTPLEFDLLSEFAKNPGHTLSREELLQRVWGYKDFADTRLVNVHVQRLRVKIGGTEEDGAQIIRTVRGEGYRAYVPNL